MPNHNTDRLATLALIRATAGQREPAGAEQPAPVGSHRLPVQVRPGLPAEPPRTR